MTISSVRRSLVYPLYRHIGLAEKVLQDVYILIRLGKRAILKALLDMKYMFDHHDVYYIYSKIYLDDYCVWIQHARYTDLYKEYGRILIIFVVTKY